MGNIRSRDEFRPIARERKSLMDYNAADSFLFFNLLICFYFSFIIAYYIIVHVQKISILPPQKRLGFPGAWGVLYDPKIFKKCVKLYWDFQRGKGVSEKIPSVGEVWIFSGTTHF